MEYGDAISGRGVDQAVALARAESTRRPDRSLADIAADAVAQTYCVCVTDGEDAAEGRLSDVHRMLIEQVVQRLGKNPGARPVELSDDL